jgi:hypothetical protein
MPVTPFHFGPGAALKAAAPGTFSFTVFAFSQVVIDLEPVTLWIFTGDPAHPYLHTCLGALPVALVSVWPGRRICQWALRVWNSRMSPAQARWLAFPPRIGIRQALVGAFLGAYSHVFIDSFMHGDVYPLAPFSRAGQMVQIVSVEALQWILVGLGVAGLALLAAYRFRRQRSQSQPSA